MSDIIIEGEGCETAVELQDCEPIIIDVIQVEIAPDVG